MCKLLLRILQSIMANKKTAEVFTDEFTAGLPPPGKFETPIVVTLCKDTMPSNIKRRQAIEAWFSEIDSEQKPEMLKRLRSLDDEEHLSAFFELAIHDYLRAHKDVLVERDPELSDGKKPDFRIYNRGGSEAFIEVRSIMLNPELKRAEQLMNSALIQLDKISTPYLLSVHFESDPETNTKPSQLKHEVNKWLKTLNLVDGGRESTFITAGGYHVEISAHCVPGLKDEPGKVHAWSDPVRILGTSFRLMQKNFKRKSGKYSEIKDNAKPFLIALCSTDPNVILEDLWSTLATYGSLQGEGAESSAGFFGGKKDQPKNPRVSAVLHCTLIQDKDNFQVTFKLMHNPNAEVPIPKDLGL